MNLLKKSIILFTVALLKLPASGFAQYQFQVEPMFNYFSDAKRYEISGTFVLPQGEIAGVVPVYDGNGYFKGDTTIKRPAKAMGIGGSIGLSLPIKATGHISCWAASIALMGNMYTWSELNQQYSVDGTFKVRTPALDATTIQVALPIGIDYKAGCDAILSKRLSMCTSLGAGFMPQFNMTNLASVSDVDTKYSFGFTPYAKAEVGFFTGMCIKLRVLYSLGNITMIDVNRSIPGVTDGPFKITSTSNVMVSLIFMPFSVSWRETNWWNTHDTYNQHDRLN
jgi:hypothetical protein